MRHFWYYTFSLQGRLDKVHRLSRLWKNRPGHWMVLAVHPFLANGAQIEIATIYDRHLSGPCQWVQGLTGIRWSTTIYYWKIWRSSWPAPQPYLFQPVRFTSLSGLWKFGIKIAFRDRVRVIIMFPLTFPLMTCLSFFCRETEGFGQEWFVCQRNIGRAFTGIVFAYKFLHLYP